MKILIIGFESNRRKKLQFLQALICFIERENTRVPFNHIENNLKLGQWVTVRRTEYKEKKLSNYQISELENVPGWTWYPQKDIDDLHLEKIRQFVEREKHCRVPQGHIEDKIRIGSCVRREQYRKGTLGLDIQKM